MPFNELPEFKYSACQVCNVAATFAEKNTSPFLQEFFFLPVILCYIPYLQKVSIFVLTTKWNKIGASISVIEFTAMTFLKVRFDYFGR